MRIEIRLTSKCNYNCSYCTDLHDNSRPQVPFDFGGLQNVVDQFDDPYVFIYGGEPTIHNDCKAITDWCIERDIDVIVQTNASLPQRIREFDPKVKLSYSYHPEESTFGDFVRSIVGTNIYEIAFMAGEPSEYRHLKMIYKDKVQYCPIINPSLDDDTFGQRVKDIFYSTLWEEVQNDYHFKYHDNGVCNFDVWFLDLKSKGHTCQVKENLLHIQDNKVYFCFNAMMKDSKGIATRDYIHSWGNVICPYNRCYFGMENWKTK